MEQLLIRVKDVAAALDVSERKVRELVGAGELRHVRVGRFLRVSRAALQEYIEANEQ